MVGKNRQEYFDQISKGLQIDLDHILVLSEPNWFFYLQVINGKPTLRENWATYRDELIETKNKFESVFSSFMQNVKTGMPDLPVDDEKSEKDVVLKPAVGQLIPLA